MNDTPPNSYKPPVPVTDIWKKEPKRIVKLFGEELTLVESTHTHSTWHWRMNQLVGASVTFTEGSPPPPWSARIYGNHLASLATKSSGTFNYVLDVERWLESELVEYRNRLMQDIPPKPSRHLESNITNVPRQPAPKFTPEPPKLFGQEMKPTGYAVPTSTAWTSDFGCIKPTITYDTQRGWGASLNYNNENIYNLGTAAEAERWVERGVVAARNKLMEAVPAEAPPEPTEEVPEILGMKLEWEPDLEQWVLPGVDNLFSLKIQKTTHGRYQGFFGANLEPAKLEQIKVRLSNIFGFIYEAAENYAYKGAPSKWNPLPEEPIEADCFVVCKTGQTYQHVIIYKAPNPQEDYKWFSRTNTTTENGEIRERWTWTKITSKFDWYVEVPR